MKLRYRQLRTVKRSKVLDAFLGKIGVYEQEYFSEPVLQYQDDTGEWKDVEIVIEENVDG